MAKFGLPTNAIPSNTPIARITSALRNTKARLVSEANEI
jgi:hypothetical protein